MMKMILAVMPTNLSDLIAEKLIEKEFRVTKFASTAGLLSGGITTLMVVTEDQMIDTALDVIRSNVPPGDDSPTDLPRVTIYVLRVKDFERV
jgi:uncharacterized protein YaaQ